MQKKRRTTKATTKEIAQSKTSEKPAVRNKARVTVKQTVSGVKTRKTRASKRGRSRSGPVTTSVFPKEFLLEAQAALRPGEKLHVISSTEARTVYIKS